MTPVAVEVVSDECGIFLCNPATLQPSPTSPQRTHDIYRTEREQPAASAKSQQNITLNQWTVGIHSRGNPGFPANTLHGNMISFEN